MLRNLMVGIGNALALGAYDPGEQAHVIEVLERALHDDQPLVRGHAAWALGQTDRGASVLRRRAAIESDPGVRDEIADAMVSD